MANLLPISFGQYFNATTRNAYAGAKVYIYTAQSRTVNKTTWQESSETTANANPIVADANGYWGDIYGNGAHYVTIKSSDDSVTIATIDDLYPTQPVSSDGSSFIVVSDVTSLKAVDVSEFTTCYLRGTTTVDDGGQGHFYYDSSSTATSDDISIITPTSGTGRWLRLNVDTLDLEDQSITQAKFGWYPLSMVEGLIVSNDIGGDEDHDIDISVGSIADRTQTYVMRLTSAFTKAIDATFAVGSGAGVGCFSDEGSGSPVALGTARPYFVYLLGKSTDPTDCDIIVATGSVNSLNDTVAVGAGFDISRRIGYVWVDGSSNIYQTRYSGGRQWLWDVAANDYSSSTFNTSGTTQGVSVPENQTGILYCAAEQTSNVATFHLITQTDQTNTAPSSSINNLYSDSDGTYGANSSVLYLGVDGSRDVFHRSSGNPAGTNGFTIKTLGYVDDITLNT
jgi:hypothetical protein